MQVSLFPFTCYCTDNSANLFLVVLGLPDVDLRPCGGNVDDRFLPLPLFISDFVNANPNPSTSLRRVFLNLSSINIFSFASRRTCSGLRSSATRRRKRSAFVPFIERPRSWHRSLRSILVYLPRRW